MDASIRMKANRNRLAIFCYAIFGPVWSPMKFRSQTGGIDASIRMIANHRGCAKNAHVQCYSSLFPDLNIHCLPTLAPARFPKIKESFMHIYEGMLTTTP